MTDTEFEAGKSNVQTGLNAGYKLGYDKGFEDAKAKSEVHHEDLLVWHYCAEELPKKNGLYFVTWAHNDSCYICLKEFSDGRWKSTLNIIAWMPCTKPCTKKEVMRSERYLPKLRSENDTLDT